MLPQPQVKQRGGDVSPVCHSSRLYAGRSAWLLDLDQLATIKFAPETDAVCADCHMP